MARLKDALINTIKNVTSKTVDGATLGEVFEKLNLQYDDVTLTVTVKDSLGAAVDSPTIVLKSGSTQGSGTSVTANANGTYTVKYGTYNISVAKTLFTTHTAIITIGYDEAKAKAKTINVVLADAE